MPTPVIAASQLTKKYKDVAAVDGISFEIAPGESFGFLGPNGAGKSTTMRMVMGLDRPSAGSATVNGKRYVEIAAPLCEVGALLDAGAMHPGRSGRSHLRIGARSNGIPVSLMEGEYVRPLTDLDESAALTVAAALAGRRVAAGSGWVGR